MEHRFIHVGFAFPGVPKMLDLEPVMTRVATDWIRYSSTNWILWTDRPVNDIFWQIRFALDPYDQVLVARMDLSDSYGFLSPWIWSWINSKRPGTTTTLASTGSALANPLAPLIKK